MSISFLNNRNRYRVSLGFLMGAALFIVMVSSFPSGSRAKLEPMQEKSVSKKATRPRFVPGEIILRYQNESTAVHKTGTLNVTARDGRLVNMKVENFEGSGLVPGLRVARVSQDQTLQAVAALREQPDVIYAEPNYIMHADVNPNDTHFVAGRQASMNTIGAPQAWNTNTGSTSIAAVPPARRLLTQKPGKPASATHFLRRLGRREGNPRACAFPFPHPPSGKNTVILSERSRLWLILNLLTYNSIAQIPHRFNNGKQPIGCWTF
jgi:hypothetical protein